MTQNHTLHHLLNSLLLSALAICSAAFAQNRPVTQYFYDANGNLTSAVDGLNRVTIQTYDTLDRLRRITQPPPAAMQPNPVIHLELNGRDDLTRVIDPRNLSTTYSVTGLSNVTTQTSPDTGVTTRTFDAAGNVLTSRDARNRTTTYTYDTLHRLTRATYGDATFSTYVYDQGANGVGRLTSMTDPGPVTTSWTYTAMGRVATKVQTIGSGTTARTHQLSYSYNPTTGQLISMTYPSGKVISYTYGATSKDLERIAINGANAASAITHHPFGGVRRMTLGNGQVWSNSLDQDGRVRTYTLAGVTYTLAWDAANRITGTTSSQTATNRTFGYDNLDRITGFATTGRSQSFAYDATGNLLAKSDLVGATQTNYTFNIAPTSNRMTGIGNLGIGYSFDAAGNRTGDGRITYAYNQRGRMNQVRIINGATTNTYNYLINGINLRVRKAGPSTVVPQGMRIFVYEDAAKLIGEYDDLGRARTEHVWLEDRPIAAITYTYTGTSTTPATTTTSYVETDHLATPRLITNASRQKRWTWESAPYGDTFPNENPQSLGAYSYNLRFPGQYFDSETAHNYNHNRDYEVTTGRYVQSDPIGLEGGLDTYWYGSANPISRFDPEGLFDPSGFLPPHLKQGASAVSRINPVAGAFVTGVVIGTAINEICGAQIGDAIDAVFMPKTCDVPIYRVFGQGSPLYGNSWTPIDPRLVPGYRALAGLPSESKPGWRRNSGKYLAIGCLVDKTGVEYLAAQSLDGLPGGLPELRVPNPRTQVKIIDVQRMSPRL